MKNKFLVLSFLFTVIFNTDSMSQGSTLIDSLAAILFPINNDEEKNINLYEFVWKNDKYVVTGRKNRPKISDIEKISAILLRIRKEKYADLMPILINIQKRHEDYFLNEWEKAFRIGHEEYEYQYEILMTLEMTLASLYVDNISSSKDKYLYIKNIYMLQWVDRDIKRKENINFFSEYIKDKWNGACLTSHFCSPALLIEKAEDLSEGMINDLQNFSASNLNREERVYFLITLGKAAVNLSSDQVEEIFISQIEEFDQLLPDPTTGRNAWIYRILGMRGREKGISFLLKELKSEELLVIPAYKLQLLCVTQSGRSVLEKRLLHEINNSRSKSQRDYLKLLLNLVYVKEDLTSKLDELYRIIDKENEIIITEFKENQEKLRNLGN